MDVLLLLLKVTVLLLFALVAAWGLRRASAAVRHALWTATFVGVLAIPVLSWLMPTVGIPVATGEPAPALIYTDLAPPSVTAMEEHAGPFVAPSPAVGASSPAVRREPAAPHAPVAAKPAAEAASTSRWPRPTLRGLALGVWLTGFIAALIAIAVSLIRLWRLAAASQEIVDPDWRATLAEVGATFGRRPARLLVGPSVTVPMAGGLLRPTIFLPVSARDWPIDQRRVVLSHETAHLAAWDPMRHLVARVALAVYWFHPLAWLAARQAAAACEQACDQAVVSRGVLPSTYARVLLRLAESRTRSRYAVATLPIVSRTRFERRLMAILTDGSRRRQPGLALTMAVVVLMTAGGVGPLVPVSVAQPEAPLVISATDMVASAIHTISPTPLRAQLSEPQATKLGPRAIAGRVVDRTTGLPVTRATVKLSHQPPLAVAPLGSAEADRLRMPAVTVPVDQEGRFMFDALPEGSFGVSAESFGYRTGYFGQQSVGDDYGSNARIELAPGERLTDITIGLLRLATISGRVTNEQGDAVVRASVQVFGREYIAGQPAWVPRRLPWQADGQGEYRVPDLGAGDYLVALVAKPSTAGGEGYLSTFYPASPRASAARVISVAPGESRTGIDFLAKALASAAQVVSVSGRVTAGGSPLTPMSVRLVPPGAEDGLLDVEALTAETSATGEFTFARVPVGEYRMLAFCFPPPESGTGFMTAGSSFNGFGFGPVGRTLRAPASPTWVLDRPMTVDRPLENLEIPLQQGARIQGQVVFEGDGPVPSSDALGRTPLLVRPAHMRNLGRMPIGGLDSDRRFQTVGLPPGRYAISLFGNPRSSPDFLGWHVVSVRVGGRDITGKPIDLGTTDVTGVELVLSNRQMQLTGIVRRTDGRPAPWARVLLFPRDPALWGDYVAFPAPRRIRQIVTDRFGSFEGAWVPPGDYLLAAAAAVPEFWMAPEYLRTLVPIATPVRVELGGKQSVDLRLK